MTNEFSAFKMTAGIVDTMVDSKLDPEEFFTFMKKYGEFIRFGMIYKKIYTAGSVDFDKLTKLEAMTQGVKCFETFLEDFRGEYESRSLQK